MTTVEVHVEREGTAVHVGTLFDHRRRGAESATCVYQSAYLADAGAYPLDPALPLVAGPQQTPVRRALFGAMSDSAPDRWGRTLITRRERALALDQGRTPRSLGELDFLLGVRDDLRQGALRFRMPDGPFLAVDDQGVPDLTDLPALLDLAARAEDDTADLGELTRLVRLGSSLGGARPKAHVRDRAGQISIAKFPSADRDTWNVMAWEKVALDLAAACQIEVPISTLLDVGGRSVLVLRRFDRRPTGWRIGYASAMTMLEAVDGQQRSYVEIAEVVEQVSRRPSEELRQLWRRMVFNVLVSNTDDHLRNHGFLHERDDVWGLAPAFDLNPDPSPGPTFLSTTLDGADRPASLEAAVAVADYFRLGADDARAVVGVMSTAVRRWPIVARRHGLGAAEIERMRLAFSAAG